MADLADVPTGAIVVLDSAPIIYYLQDHPDFAPRFSPLFEAAAEGRIGLAISTITLAEIMAGPLKNGDEIRAQQYREILCRSYGWECIPVGESIAAEAARIRMRYRLRLPDALQAATAIAVRAWALVTHDQDLTSVEGIRVLGVKR